MTAQDRPLVLLDLDGTVVSFNEGLLEVHNDEAGLVGDARLDVHAHWRSYWIDDAFEPTVAAALHAIYATPGFFAALKPYEEAKRVVRELLATFDVEVCTAPPRRQDVRGRRVVDGQVVAEKVGWLARHLPELAANVTSTKLKSRFRADALVDDHVDHVLKWSKAHPEGVGFLVERPWNADTDCKSWPLNMTRGKLWEAPSRIQERLAGLRERRAAAADPAAEIERLKAAIRKHRDERGHGRCWLDDAELYAALGEPVPTATDLALPPKCEFLRECERYWETRKPAADAKEGT